MKLSAAVPIAIQVADALATAHVSGIIDRCLKPSIVMVSDQGRVTLLDFGLAKLEESPWDASESTRMNHGQTGERSIIGTAPHMSSEEAEGRDSMRAVTFLASAAFCTRWWQAIHLL